MMTGRKLISRLTLIVCLVFHAAAAGLAEWQAHVVRQVNGKAKQTDLPAQFQIVTESWNRVVAVPYIVYIPDKDRLLLLVGCDLPHRAHVLTSRDRGATWTEPRPARLDSKGKPSIGMGTGLVYLGNGRMMFNEVLHAPSGRDSRWFSKDYGETWGDSIPIAATSGGKRLNLWDPPVVERDRTTGKVTRLVEAGYIVPKTGHDHYRGSLHFSVDGGRTWSASIKVPQWKSVSEVALIRTGDGNLLAACRTDNPLNKKGPEFNDHYAGLGTSISRNNGRTWSDVRQLYEYGRHHPSLIRLPNGEIVMTYVVRKGYVESKNGFPQFGIEAIVSRDHGQTWDLDHKYILHAWIGNQKGSTSWWPSSQATSSVLFPDGSILTAFGTGYRIQKGPNNPQAPRDVGLVRWRLNPKAMNNDTTIRDAASDSDLRNVFDPMLVSE